MKINNLLIFISGVFTGGISVGVLLKKYYEKQYLDHIKDMEKYYHKDEYVVSDPTQTDYNSEEADVLDRLTRDDRNKDKETSLINYQRYYDAAESEYPGEDEIYEVDEEANSWYKKNKNKSAKIISVEDAGELPAFVEDQTLYFYHDDEILADEDGNEIEQPELLIGDALTKFNFIDNDEKYMFVLNYEHCTCYEINKVYGSYDDEYGPKN